MKTVFVVDDSDASLFAAQKALSKHYNIYTLPSAAAMFNLLANVVPDLVLMDVLMPEMNGLEAIEKMKENDSYKDIPIILLTGQTDEDTEAQGFKLGVADFISKPFSEPNLLDCIEKHITHMAAPSPCA